MLGLASLFVCFSVGLTTTACSQELFEDQDKYTRQDKLRGSITPERRWWDLKHYHLTLEVFPETKTIQGSNEIEFTVLESMSRLQVDLQEPLKVTRVVHGESELEFEREGNAYWIEFPSAPEVGTDQKIKVFYEGTPVESKNPPWSGGFSWQKDEHGKHFIATSCQGIGASIWWPNKDHGYDEPDHGMDISVTVPQDLIAVSNGRLKTQDHDKVKKTKTFHWGVTNPINNYGINVNIGNYVSFEETFAGEKGELDVQYWVLAHQRETAMEHFKETPRTLKAFEHWFGPYPFYEDSYKLVVVPYLGMEHQSSVTYGNGFQNGYRGRDLSRTGVGLKFDFIIVHESGHEWFGNNISMKDTADMWIHESFTNYSENLFVEYHFTEKEAQDYVIGCRKLVSNDKPIVGVYGVNQEGSGDMYYKGGNMLHTIRHILNDDKKWRDILRGLNQEFWHQTVTTEQVETYMSEQSGIDLSKFFDQYLRDTRIPVLRYQMDGPNLTYYFDNVVDGFKYPVRTRINGQERMLTPSQEKQTLQCDEDVASFELDRNWYMSAKPVED